MYLSRMYLNPQRKQCRAFLSNAEMMHAAVLSCFPPVLEGSTTDGGRVLWRVDRNAEKVVLWVASPNTPSFEHLQEQAGWSQQQTWETRDYTTLTSGLMKGQHYGFRLVANPVYIETTNGVKKRKAYQQAEQQLQWLLERQQAMGVHFLTQEAGFGKQEDSDEEVVGAVVDTRVTGSEKLVFNRQGRKVTVVKAEYQGLLEVEDPDLLAKVLVSGIGKAKGYGCGLLTLARAHF